MVANTPQPKKKPGRPKGKAGAPPGIRKLQGNRLADSGLTVEQEAYSRCRASGMSIEEAIAASGGTVSIKTARNWENPNSSDCNNTVRKRINELSDIAQKNAILRTGLTREWIISRYMQVVERCMQAEPVMKKVDGEMVESGEYVFDSSGANTALRALGDTVGLFKPVDKQPGDEYEHLTDTDIERIVNDLAVQIGVNEPKTIAKPALENITDVTIIEQK